MLKKRVVLYLSIFLCFASFVSASSAYYKFENNFNDFFGNYNATGNALFSSGLDGNSADFEKSFVEIKESLLSDDYTLSVWVKPKSVLGTQYIMTTGNPGLTSSLYLDAFGRVFYKVGTSFIYSDGPLRLNQWNHVLISFKKSQVNGIKMFIDAKEQKIKSTIYSYSKIGKMYLGKYLNTNYYYFNGSIDELKVWNKQLSFDQIQKEYANFQQDYSGESIYYKFENTNNEKENFNLINKGNVEFNEGKIGKSASFNSKNSLETSSFFNNYQTISFWVKPSVSGKSQYILTEGEYRKALRVQVYIHSNNYLLFYIGSAGIYSDSPLKLNEWAHVTLTIDSWKTNGVKMFINGKEQIRKTTAYNNIGANKISLGKNNYYDLYGFSGQLDEFKVWNRVLNNGEILDNYNAIPGNETRMNCTDSDGGINLFNKSTATNGTFSGTDVCISTLQLREYSCRGVNVISNLYLCTEKEKCIDGACVTTSTPRITCTDTDGGITYNVSGNATGYNSDFSQRTTVSDRCVDSIKLYESYCSSDNRLNGIYFNCSFGCKNGACLSQVIPENKTIICTDSDGGLNYDVYGSCSRMVLTSSSGSGLGSYDECRNAITLKECYCDLNKSIAISNFDCSFGCENGKCKEQILNPEDYFSYKLSARVIRDSDVGLTNRTTIRDVITGQEICVDLAEGDICNVGNLVIKVKKVSYTSAAIRSAEFEVINNGSFWKKILYNESEELINSRTIFVNAANGVERYFVVVDYLQDKDKLVAYYKFEKDFKDLIGNYNGEGFNVEFKEGINSSAASFNGINSYIKVNDLYSKKDKYSFSMWINPLSFPNRSLFFHFGGSEGSHYAELRDDGRITFVHGESPYTYIISNSKVNFNEWSYVAVTYNGNEMQIYINGKLDSAKSSGNSQVVNNGYTLIGKSAIFYYNGLIDELKIWNYDLSEDEVKEDYGVNEINLNENVKDMSKYSERQTFLISDENWKDVLSLVPISVWTSNSSEESGCQKGYGALENVCVYPNLIYHSEFEYAPIIGENSFDSSQQKQVYTINGKSLVRFYLQGKDKEEFLKMDLDIASVGKDYVDVVLDSSKKSYFENAGYNLETIPVNIPVFSKSSGYELEAGYHTYDSMVSELSSLESNYPNLAKVYKIGSSVQGRDILAMKISDNVVQEENEEQVLVVGNHHAREIMTVEVPMYMINYLLENYNKDSKIKKVVDEYELWFVPMINPDGHVKVEEGETWWRKNARDNNNDGIIDSNDGVDLNRNYGYTWAYDNIGSSPSPTSESYRGTSAFSEPETQAIRDLALAHNFKYVLDYHSYGGVILYPWGHIRDKTEDDSLFKSLVNEFIKFNPDYRAGQIIDVMYYSNGDSIDWHYGETQDKSKILAFGIELDSTGFISPASEINSISQGQLMILLNLTGYEINFAEKKKFDADSVIYFMQQYSPDNLVIVGDSPQTLDNLLISGQPQGSGLNQNTIKKININDYLSYWKNYKDVVYVEDNYELALIASTYASLINSPLIIKDTSLDADGVFAGKNVICVGDVQRNCNENYNLNELQEKYFNITKTKKLILVNPEDLEISARDNLNLEKTSDKINNLYSKTSLIAPILASSKHELIITDNSNSFSSVDNNIESFFQNHYNETIFSCLYSQDCASGFSGNSVNMAGAKNSITLFLSGQADVSVFRVDSPDSVFVNTENKFNVTIKNSGFDSAKNVTVNVYLLDDSSFSGSGSKNSFAQDNLILIGSINLNDIEEDNFNSGIFSWIPKKVGSAQLFLEVLTSSNESNIDNNGRWLYTFVSGPSPDISVEVNKPAKLKLNSENIINFSVSNIGTQDSGNVNVFVYNINSNSIAERRIDEGSKETISFNGKSYDIEILFISASNARINVNGETAIIGRYLSKTFGDLKVNVGDIVYDSRNGGVSYLYISFGESDSLLFNKTISLKSSESSEFSFKITPNQEKWYDFQVIANTEGDINNRNNEESFSILAVLPEPRINMWSDYFDFLILNEINQLNLSLQNSGIDSAKEVVVDFKVRQYVNGQYIESLIESKSIGNLNGDETRKIAFNYKPLIKGYIEIVFNVSYNYNGETKSLENSWNKNIKDNGADISIGMNLQGIELGQTANARTWVYNDGNRDAYNVSLMFYDNNKLIKTINFSSSLRPMDAFNEDIQWVPQGIGRHEIKVIVNSVNDVNLDNNELRDSLYVYSMKNITFEIINSTSEYVSRYLLVDSMDSRPELINGLRTMRVPDVKTRVSIINTDNISDSDNLDYVMASFSESDLHSKMLVISEDYKNARVESNKRLYRIYANEVFWNYNSANFYFQTSDYINLGLKNPEDLTIYFCLNWDFESESCVSSWQESYWVNKNVDGNRLYMSAEVSSAEAFAIGESLNEEFSSEIRNIKDKDLSKIFEDYKNKQKFSVFDNNAFEASTSNYQISASGFFYNCTSGKTNLNISINGEFVESKEINCYNSFPANEIQEVLGVYTREKIKNITFVFDSSLIFYNSSKLFNVMKNYQTHIFGESSSSGVQLIPVNSLGADDVSEFNFINKDYSSFVVNALSSGSPGDLEVYVNEQKVGELDLSNSNGEKSREFKIPETILNSNNLNVKLKSKNPGQFIYLANVKMKTNFDDYYLTIVASPNAIPFENNRVEADFREYGSIDNDNEAEFSVGRIMGLTSSDFSSYLARVLFYNQIENKKQATIMMVGDGYSQRIPVITCGTSFTKCYFDVESDELFSRYSQFFEQLTTCNQDLINGVQQSYPSDCEDYPRLYEGIFNSSISIYADHGNSNSWPAIGLLYSDLENLAPQVGYSFACSTCEYSDAKAGLFCANMIRKGAIGYIGAVHSMYGHHFLNEFLDETLINNQSIGYAFKIGKNKEADYDWKTPNLPQYSSMRDMYGVHDLLIGDPSFVGEFGK